MTECCRGHKLRLQCTGILWFNGVCKMARQTRRQFLKGAGTSAGLLLAGGLAFAQQPASKPNIIFILADDLGYGDLGCYGQKQIRTPNLDKMGADGMRFTQHYAGSTVCAPSRCSLMTGLHTGHCYVRGNMAYKEGELPLPADTVTIAKLLKGAGYTTGLIGKWGLGGPGTTGVPNKQGFDYFFGYLSQVHAHNYWPDYLWRNDEKVKLDNEVVVAQDGYAKGLGTAATKCVQYSHDLFAQEALEFVERNKARPFFLYLALTIPHANNEANLVNRHGLEVPDYGPYKDRDWPEPQKGKAAMITRMDGDIGRLLEKLHNLGIDKNTLVLFSSDNGPHQEGVDPEFFDSNGPLRGIKRDLYEGGIRVPLIAYWPGHIKADSVSNHISAFWDFLPTCAELAGAKAPDGLDGISFIPTLLGKAGQKEHEYLYWEFHEKPLAQAVRMGDFKGVYFVKENRLELYNLKTDIGEQKDITAENARLAENGPFRPQSEASESGRAKVAETIKGYLKSARTPSELFRLAGS